jgi:hypothetical protein
MSKPDPTPSFIALLSSLGATLAGRFVPRMAAWLALAVALTAAVWLVAPQQVPVSLYKLSLVSMAAVVGYWIDRGLFPYARPDRLFGDKLCADDERDARARLVAAAMQRRALIVAAVVLATALGA